MIIRFFQIGFQGGEVVLADAGTHPFPGLGGNRVGIDRIQRMAAFLVAKIPHGGHHIAQVDGLGLNHNGIRGHGVALDAVDVVVNPSGQGQDKGDANDAD